MEEKITLPMLLEAIQGDDPEVRTLAWQAAGQVGAKAMKPLAVIVVEGDLEVGRAAKRAMWQIVRTVGAPDAKKREKRAVENRLIEMMGPDTPDAVRREVFWMLSEIGGDATVAALREQESIVDDEKMREDARCMLERIPTQSAVDLLQDALEEVPAEFAPAVAHSLRLRGVEVSLEDYPDAKLVPTKQTSVQTK